MGRTSLQKTELDTADFSIGFFPEEIDQSVGKPTQLDMAEGILISQFGTVLGDIFPVLVFDPLRKRR